MRISKRETAQKNYSILTLDDDPIMTSTLQAFFQRSGYHIDVEHDPRKAIERIREGHYDILLLDFLMTPICGDQVVAEIRKFNRDIFIILLTGHKSVAPPIKTIRELDIQGYYEKSDRFDQLELLVESCVKSIQQMRTIQGYRNGLSAIVDSLPRIYRTRSLEPMMDGVLSSAAGFMSAAGASLEIDLAAAGLEDGKCVLRLFGTASTPPRMDALFGEDAFAQSPVIFRAPWTIAAIYDNSGRPTGLLCVNTENVPGDDRMQLLDVFSRQVSAAIENYVLDARIRCKNEELTRTYGQLRDGYMEIIDALRLMVDAKDIYTRGHSDRVSEYAAAIAAAMGMEAAHCESIRVAGLFHDIGKVGIPDSILLKPARLTEEEAAVIKKHPVDGARILSAISHFHEIVPWVKAHHERPDGKGYPDGLSGEEIPIQARIIAVADTYDAMTSDRSYRKALAPEAAADQLLQGRGTQFDPSVVDAFMRIAHNFR